MTAKELTPGDEFEVGGKTLIVQSYAAHAVMAAAGGDGLAVPCVMLDVDGPTVSGLATVRILFEESGAREVATAIMKSLILLDNLKRNGGR